MKNIGFGMNYVCQMFNFGILLLIFFMCFAAFAYNSLCQSEYSILKYKPRVGFKVFLPEIRNFCLK